jgi:hypothetical protein
LRAALCLAWLGGANDRPAAEVSADPQSNVNTLLMEPVGITDGADPVPAVGWQPYRPIPSSRVLNPAGAIRPDGRPDVAWRANGWPVVIWAYNNGSEHDVALAAWAASAWNELEYLTATPDDERDPRLFLGREGVLHATWWVRGGEPHVMLAARAAGDVVFGAAERVSPVGRAAARPTVAEYQGSLWLAHELEPLDQAATTGEIVVLRRAPGEAFVVDHVFSVPRAAELDPLLHVQGSRLWLDWKHGADQFGWSSRQPSGWTAIGLAPWPDPSWVGIETARDAIAHAALALVPTSDPLESSDEQPPPAGDPGSDAGF